MVYYLPSANNCKFVNKPISVGIVPVNSFNARYIYGSERREEEERKKAVLFSTKAGKRIKWVRQSERELATTARYIPITIELSFHSLVRI